MAFEPTKQFKMAEQNLNIEQIIQVLRKIVKRKTIYNETNLHFEYYNIAKDTIPFKENGYETLRQFIEQNAFDFFYFEKIGNDMLFIAPKRIEKPLQAKQESNAAAAAVSNSVLDKNSETENANKKVKSVYVSDNMRFMAPQSTGMNNPFQNIQNDIRVSVDFNKKTREVDHCPNDCRDFNANESVSSMHVIENKSSSGSNYSQHKEIDFPWNESYWHLRISHAVSTDEVWARFYDEFEASFFNTLTTILFFLLNLNTILLYCFIGKDAKDDITTHKKCYRTSETFQQQSNLCGERQNTFLSNKSQKM